MPHFKTTSPQTLISLLHKRKIKIHVGNTPLSIFSLDVLRSIFQKECLSFEINNRMDSHIDSDFFHVYVDRCPLGDYIGVCVDFDGTGHVHQEEYEKEKENLNEQNILEQNHENVYNDSTKTNAHKHNITDTHLNFTYKNILSEYTNCTCQHPPSSLTTSYSLLKHLNYQSLFTLWPVTIYFSYYKVWIKDCQECNEILNEIEYHQSKNQNKKNNNFLQNTLFNTLSLNIPFLIKHKMLTNQKYRISQFLAKKGISLKSANEKILNLNEKERKLIESVFKDWFIDSKLEYYYDVVGALIEGDILYALECVRKKEQNKDKTSSNNLNKSNDMPTYNKIVSTFLSSLKRIKKVNNKKLLFLKTRNVIFLRELHTLFDYYFLMRRMRSNLFIVVEDQMCLIVGKEVVEMEREEFKVFIRGE